MLCCLNENRVKVKWKKKEERVLIFFFRDDLMQKWKENSTRRLLCLQLRAGRIKFDMLE